MRNWISLLLVLSLAVGLGALVLAQESTSDEEAIKMELDKWAEAWNQGGKVEGLSELYTLDADYVGFDGQAANGREAIVNGFAEFASTTYKGSKLSLELTSVRFIRPNLAVADNTWELTDVPKAEGEQPPTKGLSTAVFTKQDGQWLIAAHRTRIPPPAPAPGQN